MSQGYYHTRESVEEYISMAEGHNGKLLIDQLNKHLPGNTEVLELGSGPGTDWKILSREYEVTGSDLSLEFLKHLKEHNPGARFLELDAVSLKTALKFDGIYSNKVLHHLTNEELEASIRRQCKLLNPGGVICHSFWEGEGSETFKGLFVNYHSIEELRAMFAEYFEIKRLEHYQEFEAGDSIYIIGIRK